MTPEIPECLLSLGGAERERQSEEETDTLKKFAFKRELKKK